MALKDGFVDSRSDSPQPGAGVPDDAELDPLQQRLAKVEVPTTPKIPAPPEIRFMRPTLSQKALDRAFPGSKKIDFDTGAVTDANVGDGAHLGAGLVIGITFPACIIVGAVIGIWIDKHYNHSATPWATIFMTLIGIAAGLMNVYRAIGMMTRGKKKS